MCVCWRSKLNDLVKKKRLKIRRVCIIKKSFNIFSSYFRLEKFNIHLMPYTTMQTYKTTAINKKNLHAIRLNFHLQILP